jgi:hypothetical protein
VIENVSWVLIWARCDCSRKKRGAHGLTYWGRRKIAFAISAWFGGGKANSVTDGQLTTFNNVLPQSVDVIPGRLKVRIFLHEIEYEKEIFSCWSYVTDGLAEQKQKETSEIDLAP